MDEDNKFLLGMICVFVIIIGSVFSIGYYMGLDDERITVEGKIVDVDVKKEQRLAVRWDIVTLTFDNGEKYEIKYELNTYGYNILTDFTVNSKFIVELFRPDKNSYWEIEKIYKVPE